MRTDKTKSSEETVKVELYRSTVATHNNTLSSYYTSSSTLLVYIRKKIMDI